MIIIPEVRLILFDNENTFKLYILIISDLFSPTQHIYSSLIHSLRHFSALVNHLQANNKYVYGHGAFSECVHYGIPYCLKTVVMRELWDPILLTNSCNGNLFNAYIMGSYTVYKQL
jgi:hypothetical protein